LKHFTAQPNFKTDPPSALGGQRGFCSFFFRVKLGCVHKIGGTAYANVRWLNKSMANEGIEK